MLPIEIQMQIDLSAQEHHRAIAEGFAKLRERLRPGRPDVGSNLHRLLFNAAQNQFNAYQMRDLRPGTIIYVEPWQLQNAAWSSSCGGLASSFWGGVFGSNY